MYKVAFLCGRWMVRTFFFFALLVPTVSQAGLITPEEFGATFFVESPDVSTTSYDANTDLLTMNGPLGSRSGTLSFAPLFHNFFVTDIIGTVSLTATVDGTGTFLGGSYSWFGGSVSLGIAAGTEILSGALTSVGFFDDGAHFPTFQSVGTIDVIDPLFASFVGPAERLLIWDFHRAPVSWISGGLWSTSFSTGPGQGFADTPSMWGAPAAAIPEPETYAMLLAGLGFLGVMVRRRRRVSVQA